MELPATTHAKWSVFVFPLTVTRGPLTSTSVLIEASPEE